jgi:ABC-type sulfate transport system substrate-binding protein
VLYAIYAVGVALSLLVSSYAIAEEWFQTWERPDYQEWAQQNPEGYLLCIMRKEKHGYLVAKAKLIMGESGLPGFNVIGQYRASTEEQAKEHIQLLKEGIEPTCKQIGKDC